MELIVKAAAFGKGVFAGRDLNVGETILQFGGPVLRYDQLPKPYDSIEDHYMQIGDDLYLGPSGQEDDWINHSCDPNSGVRILPGGVFLVSIKPILKGDEIFWDYSTTLKEDEWEMDCRCGSAICRKRVGDFKHLPASLQAKYQLLKIVPDFLLN